MLRTTGSRVVLDPTPHNPRTSIPYELRLARMKISICAAYAKERFETARQHSILHPELIVGNSWRWDFFCLPAIRESSNSWSAVLNDSIPTWQLHGTNLDRLVRGQGRFNLTGSALFYHQA